MTPVTEARSQSGATGLTLIGAGRREVQATVTDVGPREGRPVVFLHGLVGLNDHWEEVGRRVQDRLRCVMVELPLLELRGDDCSIDGVTGLVKRFLLQYLAGGQGAVLVGNSFGGHVALRIALERPDLVGGLVLAGSSGIVEKTMVTSVQRRPTREWMRRRIAELYHDESVMREVDVDRAFTTLTDRGAARAMVKLSRTARRNALGDHIGQITAPTLIVWGRQDVVTPPEAAREFHRLIPGSRLVWFDECGHVPMQEKPAEFGEALAEFTLGLG